MCKNKCVDHLIKPVCVNQLCKNQNKQATSPYCPLCGTKVLSDNYLTVPLPRVMVSDVSEKVGERLFLMHNDEVDSRYFDNCFVPLDRFIPDRSRYFHFDGFLFAQEYKTSAISDDRAWLCTEFATEIGILKQCYGNEHVKIAWGHIGQYI